MLSNLTIYNSLSRQKEPFVPRIPGRIGLYVCGITVYDHCHLGHARAMVCFDVMVRFLQSIGYEVTYVKNITDIDDKIIVRALEQGIPFDALTARYIASMHEDMAALGCLFPTVEPRATTSIDAIIQLIERLLEKNVAYVSAEGDVCFEVACFEGYGKLSHKDLEGLMSGARVEVAQGKRSPLDFVLWKRAKPNEPSWPSPFGSGRPGWHIECSAMAMNVLGNHFDIHGGGLDLQFPHHENEIAQSECATGESFANYWLHVGMLQLNHEKMSKSTGNFLTIKDALKTHHPEVLRYFLLSSHYRSSLNYASETLQMAEKALTRLYQAIRDIQIEKDVVVVESWVSKFNEAMLDDFNTPVALSVLFDLSREVNKTQDKALALTLIFLGNQLGLLKLEAVEFLRIGVEDDARKAIESLIEARLLARQAKNWAHADEIREQLTAMGIEIEDKPEGTVWRRKSS